MSDAEGFPARKDKRLDEDGVVSLLESGMTIGIGGWGAAASRCRSCGRSCAAT